MTNKWILAQKFRIINIQFTDQMKFKRSKTKVWVLWLFWQNTHSNNYGDKVWARDWRKGHPETLLPGDSLYKQSPNSDIIIDVKKCITKGACCGCPLRGPARALQIQRQMLAVNHCAESGVLKGRDEGENWRSWGGLEPHGMNSVGDQQTL